MVRKRHFDLKLDLEGMKNSGRKCYPDYAPEQAIYIRVESVLDCSLIEHLPSLRFENRFTCKDTIQDFFVKEDRIA